MVRRILNHVPYANGIGMPPPLCSVNEVTEIRVFVRKPLLQRVVPTLCVIGCSGAVVIAVVPQPDITGAQPLKTEIIDEILKRRIPLCDSGVRHSIQDVIGGVRDQMLRQHTQRYQATKENRNLYICCSESEGLFLPVHALTEVKTASFRLCFSKRCFEGVDARILEVEMPHSPIYPTGIWMPL